MKKVLIVEDDPIVAHIYRTRIEKEGYQVETCADGQAGFYRIHEFHPDAVLLDLMLPKMNGLEILKKIRAQTQFKSVPIIVLTNAYLPHMVQEATTAGATLVFNKASLNPREILEALAKATQSTASATPAKAAPANTAQLTVLPDPAVVDAQFQAETSSAFLEGKAESLAGLRKAMHDLSRAPDETERNASLLELYRRVHSLTGTSGISGFNSIARLTAGVEVLLKELRDKPANLNASTLRTVAHSIDFIGELLHTAEHHTATDLTAEILVVDDEVLSRRAITYALEKASLKPVGVEDPNAALQLATAQHYDLVFLDVQMPGMDGFELCTKIRALPLNKTTPIIFVTSLTDFKTRGRV